MSAFAGGCGIYEGGPLHEAQCEVCDSDGMACVRDIPPGSDEEVSVCVGPGMLVDFVDTALELTPSSAEKAPRGVVRTDKKAGWGWMFADAEEAHGQFTSREEALVDCARYMRENHYEVAMPIAIGRCVDLAVEPWATQASRSNAAWLAETVSDGMAEAATEEEFCFVDQDELFKFEDVSAAEDALAALVVEWAKKWVKPAGSFWWLDSDETVEVEPEEAPCLHEDLGGTMPCRGCGDEPAS